jgi:hypothetical protein
MLTIKVSAKIFKIKNNNCNYLAMQVANIKNNNCNYLAMQVADINNNNCLFFYNKINADFKNNIEITKRYIHKAVKILPINLIEIDKRLWINSSFYNSYKNEPEIWHEINLSTNKTQCIAIKKIISLYNYALAREKQKICYSIIADKLESVVENQDNEHLVKLLADKCNTIAFGELGNGSPFIINYYSSADYNTGSIVIASNWENLIDYMNQQDVNLFILGMHSDSLKQVTALQQINNEYNNFTKLKLLLKQNLASLP